MNPCPYPYNSKLKSSKRVLFNSLDNGAHHHAFETVLSYNTISPDPSSSADMCCVVFDTLIRSKDYISQGQIS